MSIEEETSQLIGNLLFPKIFQSFRMAIQPSKLIISISAMTIICLAGWLMDFSRTVVVTEDEQGKVTDTELEIYMFDAEMVSLYTQASWDNGDRRGVFSTLWRFASKRFHNALNSLLVADLVSVKNQLGEFFRGIGWALRFHLVYCVIFFLIKSAY